MNIFKGFLLSYIRYGEQDAVLNLYTHSQGYISFFAKGLFAPKSKKKAYLSPLNELEIYVRSTKQGQLAMISKIELLKSNYQENNLSANCICMFTADFLNQVLKNENENQQVYKEIVYFIDQISSKNINAHLILVFIFLKLNGLLPLISEATFLNPESGSFEDVKSHPLFDETTSNLWKRLGVENNTYSVTLNRGERGLLMDSMMVYYSCHYHHFRIPESLEILKQVFE